MTSRAVLAGAAALVANLGQTWLRTPRAAGVRRALAEGRLDADGYQQLVLRVVFAELFRRARNGAVDVDVAALGPLYEGLLDFRPRVRLDDEPTFELLAGHGRKRTGSYYTPPELVAELVRQTLEPIAGERLASARTTQQREQALLSIRVCDPAAGSGHLLLAAARWLGRELARVRGGARAPDSQAVRTAVGDVARVCIYGVDRDPLAVELCRLALWSESGTDGATSLCGDSLRLDWPRVFPDVFAQGGFDVVLANPPWDKVELNESEFFAAREPGIAGLAGTARKQAVARLRQRDPLLWAELERALVANASLARHVKQHPRFALTGSGRLNLYALFAELAWGLLNPRGRAGLVLPTGIATDNAPRRFFQAIIERRALVTLLDFENRRRLFQGVDGRTKLCLLVLAGSPVQTGQLAFFLHGTHQLADERRRFRLRADDLALFNSNTRTCPIFRTRVDADLIRRIYQRVPVLVDERRGLNPWGVRLRQGLFNMTSDSHLFHTEPAADRLPLYEAKLFHQLNHRWATHAEADGHVHEAEPRELANPSWRVQPRYWIAEQHVEARLAASQWQHGWLLVSRMIAPATNERTWLAAVCPRVGVGNSAAVWLLDPREPALWAALLANLNALVMDYVVKQKVGGSNLNFFIVKQLPVLPPESYSPADLAFVVPRVLELSYTAWDLQPYARDLGYNGPPFAWDEARRAELRAELDAHYAGLYGLSADELRYVLDPCDVYGPDFPGETFRVLKERELKQYGEYRTRRLVLAAFTGR